VAQREDGVWDVVDGLQRLSTIFELAGILRDDEGKKLQALKLERTKYLPSLAGKVWSAELGSDPLTQAQRLYVKRAKIDVKIIKKESTKSSKYELFQRLNTGGSPLTDQEVRNCMLISIDKPAFEWMQSLQSLDVFQTCIAVTDKARDEQYDMELVLRFLALASASDTKVRAVGDIGEYLNDFVVEQATKKKLTSSTLEQLFKDTFSILASTLEEDSFRRYDPKAHRFKGGFLISAFEAIGLGTASNIKDWNALGKKDRHAKMSEVVKALWQDQEFLNGIGSGKRASQRIPTTIPLGRQKIKP
jgi:hypothetical protein